MKARSTSQPQAVPALEPASDVEPEARAPAELPFRQRVAATLSLVLGDERARLIAARAGRSSNRDGDLRRVTQQAIRAHRLARLRARLPLSSRSASGLPLSATSRLPSQAAVTLALHLGLDLTAQRLARLQGREPDDVGQDLARARAALGQSVAPCPDFDSLVGRYRDPSLDIQQRLSLFHHARSCPACGAALESARQCDDELLRSLAERATLNWELPSTVDLARRWLLDPLPIVALLALFLALGAGVLLTGFSGIFDRTQAAVPLAVAAEPPVASGWLVRTTISGRLEALNLATGERRVIVPGSWWGGHMLSPSKTLIATWRTSDEGSSARGTVEIAGLDGIVRSTWGWTFPATARFPRAWIDDATMLFSEAPIYRGDTSTDVYLARLSVESKLVAIDVATGDTRTVFTGWVARATPSPDGRYIALVREQDPTWGGRTIEIRRFDRQQVGEVVTKVENRYIDTDVGPVWSPDSTVLYLPVIGETKPLTLEQQYMIGTGPPTSRVSLASLTIDNTFTQLTSADEGVYNSPIGVSPDGQHVIFVRQNPLARPNEWSVWQTRSDGSDMQQLIGRQSPRDSWDSGVLWSPDGQQMLLADTEPFFVPPATQPSDVVEGTATALLTFNGGSPEPTLVRREVGFWGSDMLAWLPANALPPTAPSEATAPAGRGSDLALAGEPHLTTGPDTAVSPDQQLVLLRETSQSTPRPSIREIATGVDLQAEVQQGHDFSWLSSGNAVVGVGTAANGPRTGSRIALFSAEPDRPTPDFLDRYFDPAGIGTNDQRVYAQPSVSPTQAEAVFYVRDQASGTVELWLAPWNAPPQQVIAWQLPDDKLLEPPIAGTWLDDHVYLFAQPDQWQAGLPRRVVLKRLMVDAQGSATVTTVKTWSTRGNERGLVLQELSLDRQGSQLAVRLRHFDDLSVSQGLVDSLLVARVANVNSAVELIRGAPGEGIAWSPDGAQLAVALRGRIAVMTADGRRLHYLSTDGTQARYPVWVTDRTIWYSRVEDDGTVLGSLTVDPPS